MNIITSSGNVLGPLFQSNDGTLVPCCQRFCANFSSGIPYAPGGGALSYYKRKCKYCCQFGPCIRFWIFLSLKSPYCMSS